MTNYCVPGVVLDDNESTVGFAISEFPQFTWRVFIRPNNRMQVIRVVRVVEHVRGNIIGIKEAAEMIDSWPIRRGDGYIGPVYGDYNQHTPAYVIYDLYRYFGMDATIEEHEEWPTL